MRLQYLQQPGYRTGSQSNAHEAVHCAFSFRVFEKSVNTRPLGSASTNGRTAIPLLTVSVILSRGAWHRAPQVKAHDGSRQTCGVVRKCSILSRIFNTAAAMHRGVTKESMCYYGSRCGGHGWDPCRFRLVEDLCAADKPSRYITELLSSREPGCQTLISVRVMSV